MTLIFIEENCFLADNYILLIAPPERGHLNPILELNKQKNDCAVILWNHRWEYDKNPELFFTTLFDLDNRRGRSNRC